MSDKVQKVAIFGGSFDPVTNAHEQIVRRLSKKFDRVVVLPCYVSPFKHEGCAASGEDRVKMFRKVTADLENVKVSKWEIKREKVSYSADAVCHYAEKYDGAQIYFVIGSDCLAGLPEWKEADYLARAATFYVLRRVGFPVKKKEIEALRALGFRIEVASGKVSDDSSALVRAAMAFGKAAELVPPAAMEHILKHELYGEYRKYTAAYRTFGLKEERIEHTYRAVKAGIWLCKLYDEDIDEVIKALLLHDVGKNADAGVLRQYNIELSKRESEMPKAIRHAYVSADIARYYFDLGDRIVEAIRKHTTGGAEMSALDKIVYLADAVEEGRDYEGVAALRRLAAKDLDRAMLRSLKDTLKRLKAEGGEIDEETVVARDYFMKVCKAKADAAKAAPVFTSPSKPRNEPEKHGKSESVMKPDVNLADADAATLARFIGEKLAEKKGRDIALVDVSQKTVVADYFVIAGAGSTTAVRALAEYVDEKLSKDHGIEPLRRDVSPKWAVLDYGSVIVHVQHEEAREFYRLEKLWDNGDNITRI